MRATAAPMAAAAVAVSASSTPVIGERRPQFGGEISGVEVVDDVAAP
jgi:hypothetical protein